MIFEINSYRRTKSPQILIDLENIQWIFELVCMLFDPWWINEKCCFFLSHQSPQLTLIDLDDHDERNWCCVFVSEVDRASLMFVVIT